MRERVRSLLLLLLLGALLLEGLSLLRAPLIEALHRAYPAVGVTIGGDVVYYDGYERERPYGRTEIVRELDTARNPDALLAKGAAGALAGLAFTGTGARGSDLDFDYARFLRAYARSRVPRSVPLTPIEQLVRETLGSIEATRRLSHDHSWSKMPVVWRVENDRLVCREVATRRVLAGLGPDGYATGEKADAGERFGPIAAGPLSTRKAADRWEWVFLDWDNRRILAVSMPGEQAAEGSLAAESTEPVALKLEVRPLHALAGAAPTDRMPFCAITGGRALAFLGDGSVIAEIELEPGEQVLSTTGGLLVRADVTPDYFGGLPSSRLNGFGIETAFFLTHPADQRRRLRSYWPGQPEVVRDIFLTPTRPSEVFLANLAAAPALLRPLPLVLASAVSPLGTGRWWWRDPWLAGGSYVGWLLASLAFAAFLAWRARRAARERCATVREVRFWTTAVFLLGPLGFLWMKLVLPRVPVEAVGGAWRAVHLDASPSTAAPWPDPKPLGIEVFS